MNPMERSGKRRSAGRKKIDIKPISKEESRQVCFSKRRQGVFKKANELCTLCGAEVAVLVFSPAGKPYSYGHPSVDTVLQRFLGGGNAAEHSAAGVTDPYCAALGQEFAYWTELLEGERGRRAALEEALRAPWSVPKPIWWDADLCSMGLDDLKDYAAVLLQQRAALLDHCFLQHQQDPSDMTAVPPFFEPADYFSLEQQQPLLLPYYDFDPDGLL